jgi:lysozyme
MQYSSKGLALTKRFEGLRLSAYRDGAGVLTIAEPEAEALLARDMALAVSCVNSWVDWKKVTLTQGQFDALVDFTYNAGVGSFRSSTLLRLVNAGDSNGAVGQFGLWVHAGGKVEPGLVRRRAAEAARFMGVQQ